MNDSAQVVGSSRGLGVPRLSAAELAADVARRCQRTPTWRRAAPWQYVGELAVRQRCPGVLLPGRRGLQGVRGAGEVAQCAPLRTRTAEASEFSAVGQADGPPVSGPFEDQAECVHERLPRDERLRYGAGKECGGSSPIGLEGAGTAGVGGHAAEGVDGGSPPPGAGAWALGRRDAYLAEERTDVCMAAYSKHR
jgi:hypothetical protein